MIIYIFSGRDLILVKNGNQKMQKKVKKKSKQPVM